MLSIYDVQSFKNVSVNINNKKGLYDDPVTPGILTKTKRKPNSNASLLKHVPLNTQN